MHDQHWKMLTVGLLLICALVPSAIIGEDSKSHTFGDFEDEEIMRQIKQKELVALVMTKPENCDILSEKHDELQVHYTGYLATGEIFDSSESDGKDPITFELGSGQVIRGWEDGLLNMCAGEKRRLIVPPNLGYGKTGFPPVISPDATLLFEVTLVSLRKQGSGSYGDGQYLLQLVKFLFLPALVLYVFYYLYGRYKAETLASKEQKRGKSSRKKK